MPVVSVSRAFVPALFAALLAGGAVPPARAATPRASRPAAPARVLPFIEDDYDRALHEARARRIPIFIESWAPW